MKHSLAMSVLILLLTATAATAGTRVVYPAPEEGRGERYADLVTILRTALDRTVREYGPYTLQPSRSPMNEARYLAELSNPAGEVNVVWSGTSTQKERDYLPIRIPLRKGILGYRIALIAKERQAEIDKIQSVEDLRRLVVGQGFGWGDTAVLQANGLKVYTAGFDSLFKLVAASRIDIFPCGINEVFTEYAARREAIPNLAVEKNLLIYYPWPYYFFFNKSNKALAKRVETGVRKMMKDGSFDAIFTKFNRASIIRANLKNRRIIRLKNPNLPKETPLGDPALWFDPGSFK